MDTRLTKLRPLLVTAVALVFLSSVSPPTMAGTNRVDVHGFASQGYMGSTEFNYLTESLNGSWAMSEYAVNVGSSLTDDLRIGVQLFARNLGDLGNNRVDIDWAYGNYRVDEWLGIRAGRVKMPYGLYNETADFDHVRTSVLMPQGVYDIRMRDMRNSVNGVNPYGRLAVGNAGSLEYAGVLGFITHPKDGGSVGRLYLDAGFPFTGIDNKRTMTVQLVWNTPIQGLRLGHTYSNLESSVYFDISQATATFLGTDIHQELHFDKLEINTSSVEFSHNFLMIAAEYNTWRGPAKNAFWGYEMNSENWYVQGSYRLNSWFEFGSYYSVHNTDRDNRGGEGYDPNYAAWQKDLALSTRFDVSSNMILKIEGHYMDGFASILMMENEDAFADPSGPDQNWYMFTTKLSFVF